MHRQIELHRLIIIYRNNPENKNRENLQSYIDKNPVAVHLASVIDTDFLRFHGFTSQYL